MQPMIRLILDYFFKEHVKEKLPNLLMHVMNSGIVIPSVASGS